MAGRVVPWRRKPKIKSLQGSLDTALTFAVVASSEKFTKKLHAYLVFKLLQELGAEVYPVATDLETFEKTKVYPNLRSLPKKVDVVIPCLPDSFSLGIVAEAKDTGINKIWFQQKTLSQEAEEFCFENNMEIIQGCVLMYQEFTSILKFLHPCFWHHKTFTRKQK